MNRSRALATAAAVLVLLATAACGDDDDGDDDDPTAQPTTAEPTTETTTEPAATTDPPDDGAGALGGQEFELDTDDDSADVEGTASSCDNPDESTLKVTFAGGGATVSVDVTGGTGSVTVSGSTEFEGQITQLRIGDDGELQASGTGSLADPGASPTSFEIEGRC